jgi:lysophospholipase-2
MLACIYIWIYTYPAALLLYHCSYQLLAAKMPYTKFILPTAPTQPVTMNMGMSMPSWYDITGLDERSNENCAGIEISQARIAAILQQEHETTGLSYSRMVLAGFSQGGALSLYTGMQLPQPLAAVVVMSGYLPHASAFKVTQPTTPVWHGHGTQDPVVAFPLCEKSRTMVMSKGCLSYTIKKYPIAHTVSQEEISDVFQFLQSVLPDDAPQGWVGEPSCRVHGKERIYQTLVRSSKQVSSLESLVF